MNTFGPGNRRGKPVPRKNKDCEYYKTAGMGLRSSSRFVGTFQPFFRINSTAQLYEMQYMQYWQWTPNQSPLNRSNIPIFSAIICDFATMLKPWICGLWEIEGDRNKKIANDTIWSHKSAIMGKENHLIIRRRLWSILRRQEQLDHHPMMFNCKSCL